MKKEYASDVRLSQLTLVDGPPTASDAPADTGAPTATGAEAASGAGQASADQPAAPPIELRPHSTHVGDAQRHPGTQRTAPRAPPLRAAAGARSDPDSEGGATEPRGDGVAWLNRKRVILIAGTLASVLLVAGLIGLRSPRGDPPQQSLAQSAPANNPNPSSPSSSTTALVADTPTLRQQLPSEDYAGKLQALKSAGNWNVLVIYAGEWTRKQPANPEAWRELSAGYLKLHQLRDALDAATQAVQVAPDGFLGWQNLGLVNVALQQSADALVAFERAVALNDKDVLSLVQTGTLNTQLGRYPEARIAFAKALLASPENIDALCGATAVAQKEGRAQDVEAMSGQLKSLNGSCPDPYAAQRVRVRVVASPGRDSKGESPARH